MSNKVTKNLDANLNDLENRSRKDLYNYYLQYCENDYDPTEEEFGEELYQILLLTREEGKLKFRNIISLKKGDAYQLLLNVLYYDTLPYVVAKSHKINIKNLFLTFENILSTQEVQEWLKYLQPAYDDSDEQELSFAKYRELLIKVCQKLPLDALETIDSVSG